MPYIEYEVNVFGPREVWNWSCSDSKYIDLCSTLCICLIIKAELIILKEPDKITLPVEENRLRA